MTWINWKQVIYDIWPSLKNPLTHDVALSTTQLTEPIKHDNSYYLPDIEPVKYDCSYYLPDIEPVRYDFIYYIHDIKPNRYD